jgi:elongator complex protein 1
VCTFLTEISRRSSRSKRKQERKNSSGKKGSVNEEAYLLNSIGKLVGTFNNAQSECSTPLLSDASNVPFAVDVRCMLPHSLQLMPDRRSQAIMLKDDVEMFRQELSHALEEIWDTSSENGQARKTESVEKPEKFDLNEKPVKPVLRIEMLDIVLSKSGV